MKIEFHILQNLAPANLNRDDTGAPKDCEFGGTRRARVSSQCWKRAVRESFRVDNRFKPEELAVRTKRLLGAVVEALGETSDAEQARAVVRALLQGAGFGLKDDSSGAGNDPKTEYLLYLPRRHVEQLAKIAREHWDELLALAPADEAPEEPADAPAAKGAARPKKGAKEAKGKSKSAFPPVIAKKVQGVLDDTSGTPDLALFGRMIADKSEWNVDAACQVAHALSTNRVTMDFDFFTAVDDLRPKSTQGSDMMGTVQFNSACFYRYAVLDVDTLRSNLGGAGSADPALVERTVDAFARSFVRAIPTGKQNSMAAHNPPSYVLAVVRRTGPAVALTNAFARAVRPVGDVDLVTASIRALESHLQNTSRMHGTEGVSLAASVDDRDDRTADAPDARLAVSRLDGIDGLAKAVVAAACGAGAA